LRRIYGIYNISAQTELLPAQLSSAEAKYIRENGRLVALKDTPGIPRDTIRMIEAKVKGIAQELRSIQMKMDTFNRGLPMVGVVEKQYLEANQSLSEDRERLKQILATYKSDASAIMLVEEAQVPVIKSRPQRSIIVIAAVAIALIFGLVGIMLFETYRDINWKEILDDKTT
jgi:tyrosine-protein kinase Etk/Wzc